MNRFCFSNFHTVLALTLVGCQLENELDNKPPSNTNFDTSSSYEPPVDTASEENTDDSGGTVVVNPVYCDERVYEEEVVAQDAKCEGGPATPDWDLELLWEKQIGSGTYSPLVVGQLDDDDGDGDVDENDIPDIIAMDTSANLHSIRGSDGSTNWTRATTNTVNTLAAIGDLDGDGWPDVLTDINYTMTALDGRTGATLWTGPSSSGKNKGSCGAVGMADLDGDGNPEAYLGSKIVNGTNGSLRGNGSEGDGLGVGNSYGHSIAGDIDDDGIQEVIVGNAAYDPDGNTIWANGETDGTVAIGDLNVDGSPELVSVGNYGVITMDNTGDVIWEFDVGGALVSTPVIADLDGDGFPEVIIPTATKLFAITSDGDELWTLSASGTGSGRGGASAFDLDGDGSWEVIWASPTETVIVDGTSGDPLATYPGGNTSCAGPVPIVDLDGDDHADIVVISSSGRISALKDTSGFTDARSQWHQSDYSLTNIDENGQLPTAPEPNWKGANNFRAGETVAIVQSLYPVVRGVCSDECAEDTVWIWYSIANSGWYELSGNVEIDIYGVTDTGVKYITSDTYVGTISPGELTYGEFIELRNVPQPLLDIQVRIVGTSNPDIEDCQESDDITYWESPICE